MFRNYQLLVFRSGNPEWLVLYLEFSLGLLSLFPSLSFIHTHYLSLLSVRTKCSLTQCWCSIQPLTVCVTGVSLAKHPDMGEVGLKWPAGFLWHVFVVICKYSVNTFSSPRSKTRTCVMSTYLLNFLARAFLLMTVYRATPMYIAVMFASKASGEKMFKCAAT